MLFTGKESLEDLIIRLLSEGKLETSALFEQIHNNGNKSSIQAMYKALRFLIKSSVLVKSGQEVAISQEWISLLNNSLDRSHSIPILSEGESVQYLYKSLINLDAYWKHLIKTLEDQYKEFPVFIYNPYGIWFHIQERQESQTGFISEFQNHKRYCYLVFGNNSEADKQIKKTMQNEFLQIDAWSKSSFKTNEYFTIIENYIVTTKLSKKMTSAINAVYQNTNSGEDLELALNNALKVKDSAKVKIERNNKKAKLLRKKLSKNFFIASQIKEKFHLF